MSRVFLTYLTAFGVGLCWAQESKPAGWQSLLKSGKREEARSLCSGWLTSTKETTKLVEAHKCLANVALCGNGDVLTLHNQLAIPIDDKDTVLKSRFAVCRRGAQDRPLGRPGACGKAADHTFRVRRYSGTIANVSGMAHLRVADYTGVGSRSGKNGDVRRAAGEYVSVPSGGHALGIRITFRMQQKKLPSIRHLIGMTSFSSKWILSHSTRYNFFRSRQSHNGIFA
jgi:hypothetical protein